MRSLPLDIVRWGVIVVAPDTAMALTRSAARNGGHPPPRARLPPGRQICRALSRLAQSETMATEREWAGTISSTRTVRARFKPLNRNVIEERPSRRPAYAIIVARPLANVDSKDGEMSEWLKEHAWK